MRTAPVDQGGQRTVIGRIHGPAGSILMGTGFTLSRTGPGDYTVRFAPPFRAVPAITANAESAAVGSVQVNSATAESASFRIFSSGSTAADLLFNFIATGLSR